jgi:hypothetical protein
MSLFHGETGRVLSGASATAFVAIRAFASATCGRFFCREAVGDFPGSDDFLYINDKKSILRWAISV